MKKIALLISFLFLSGSFLLCGKLNMLHWGISKIGFEVGTYLQKHKFSKIEVLRKDKELRKICLRKIGEHGYSALLDSKGYILIHPNKEFEGKSVFELKDQTAFEVIKKSLPDKFARGFYKWLPEEKYMCIVPVVSKSIQKRTFLVAYTLKAKYMDASYKKNLEESLVHDDEIFYLSDWMYLKTLKNH